MAATTEEPPTVQREAAPWKTARVEEGRVEVVVPLAAVPAALVALPLAEAPVTLLALPLATASVALLALAEAPVALLALPLAAASVALLALALAAEAACEDKELATLVSNSEMVKVVGAVMV